MVEATPTQVRQLIVQDGPTVVAARLPIELFAAYFVPRPLALFLVPGPNIPPAAKPTSPPIPSTLNQPSPAPALPPRPHSPKTRMQSCSYK